MFLPPPPSHSSPLEMANSQFDKAFAILEQSFRDANFVQAYKALPSRQATEAAESPITKAAFFDDDSDDNYSDDSSMHEGYRPKDPLAISLMRSASSSLPPTPPVRSRDVSATTCHRVPLPAIKHPGNCTPPYRDQSLTPDLTRPNHLAARRPAMPPQSCSSRAESFMTARETQSQASLEAGYKWLDATRDVRWGNTSESQWIASSRETTPTQASIPPNMTSKVVETCSDKMNFTRNVTVRKTRAGNLQQQQHTPKQEQQSPTTNHNRSNSMDESDASPNTVRHAHNLDWPGLANEDLYRQMRDEKSKRLSSTSTVIEAFVLAGPSCEPRQPALRRVSKVDALRDDTSHASSSRRGSMPSPKKAPLEPAHKHLITRGLDATRAVSNPETARLIKLPEMVIPERRSSRSSASMEAFKEIDIHKSRHKRQSPSLETSQYAVSAKPSREDQEDLNGDIWLDYAAPEHEHRPRPRLRHASAPIRRDTYFETTRDTCQQQNSPSANALSDCPSQSSPRMPCRMPSDTGDSTRLDEACSPFSQLSDPMELAQAKTVHLYPHANESLVIVQDVTKNGTKQTRNTSADRYIDTLITPQAEDGLKSHTACPAAMPNTPKTPMTPIKPNMEEFAHLQADSPLRKTHPSPQPPQLPAVIVIPATPSSLFRATPVQEQDPPAPPRRPSLVEKARRYSESLIQPFLPSSLQKSSSSRRNSTSSQRPQTSQDRDTTLHPLWRPRGFWDEFSDYSDEDYDDFYDSDDEEAAAAEEEDDRLPRGGDTSDVRSLDSFVDETSGPTSRSSSWHRRLSARLPSFRGSGRFLPGNSSSLDGRFGGNSRRPHVFGGGGYSSTAVALAATAKYRPDSPTRSKTRTRTTTTARVRKPAVKLLLRFLGSSQSTTAGGGAGVGLKKKRSVDMLRAAAQSSESLRRLSQRHVKKRTRRHDWRGGFGFASGLRGKIGKKE
jgi:hypothetical protein